MWGTINVIYTHNSTKKISKDRQTSSKYSMLQLGNSKSNPIARQILTASWTGGGYGTFRRMYWSGLTLILWKGNGSTALMREVRWKNTESHHGLWVYCWLGPFLEAVLSTQHMSSKGKSDTNNDHTSSHTMLYCTLPEIPLNCEPTTQLWTNIFVTLLMCLTSNGYGVLKLADSSRLMD